MRSYKRCVSVAGLGPRNAKQRHRFDVNPTVVCIEQLDESTRLPQLFLVIGSSILDQWMTLDLGRYS